MAITNIKLDVTNLTKRNVEGEVTYTALKALNSTNDSDIYATTTKTYGISFLPYDRDDKYVVLINNSGAASGDLYVKGSDNPSYGANSDLKITVANGKTVAITFDSANYAQYKAEGARKGEIIILGAAATMQVAVVKLP